MRQLNAHHQGTRKRDEKVQEALEVSEAQRVLVHTSNLCCVCNVRVYHRHNVHYNNIIQDLININFKLLYFLYIFIIFGYPFMILYF